MYRDQIKKKLKSLIIKRRPLNIDIKTQDTQIPITVVIFLEVTKYKNPVTMILCMMVSIIIVDNRIGCNSVKIKLVIGVHRHLL